MSENTSDLRAEVNPKFKYKFLLIGLVSLLIGLYHFYDPIFVYPGMRPASEAYYSLKEKSEDDGVFQRAWTIESKAKGWKDEAPKYKPEELTTNTIYSYGVGFLFTIAVGVPCLITFLRCLGQWVGVKDNRLVNSKGQEVALDQITKIDKAKWEKKGIAKLTYSDGGKEKSFLIDDLKFDRETSDKIMVLVEEAVGVDKIEGGESEAVYMEQREQAAKEKEERRLAREAEYEEPDEVEEVK